MPASEPLPLFGRTIAVTGPTSGVGRQVAQQLCEQGAHVLLLGRNPARLRTASSEINALCERDCTEAIECDLSSFDSVREAASAVCETHEHLDALVNNAAILGRERTLTPDGNETTFQVNHLSHFLLTNLLRAPLTAAAPSRVVVVSSDAHFYSLGGVHFEDLGYERGWTSFRAYAHSKLANIMFAYELAERWTGSGVTGNAVHPGPVSSGLGREGWGYWSRFWDTLVPKLTAEQAASDVVWLAESADVEGASGLYYYRRRPKRSSGPSHDRDARRRLWDVSARLTGLHEEDTA